MKRVTRIDPGYNCGTGGKDCQHEKRGDHGISSDSWYYAVTDETRAVSLLVFSGDYPPSVERATLPAKLQKPWGAYLHFHVADSTNGEPCDLVSCGKCKMGVSCLEADECWEEHHVGEQREQPESFWVALESRLPE